MIKALSLMSNNWNATDPEAAERFYTQVLGGTSTGKHRARPGEVTRVQFGDTMATGVGIFDATDGPRPQVPHQSMRMAWPATLEEAKRELAELGAPVIDERVHGQGPGFSVYVIDPMGNRLELSFDPPK